MTVPLLLLSSQCKYQIGRKVLGDPCERLVLRLRTTALDTVNVTACSSTGKGLPFQAKSPASGERF